MSNASLYDGATALVGGGAHVPQRRTARAWWWRAASTRGSSTTLRTYGAGAGYTVDVAAAPDGAGGIPAPIEDDAAAVIVQHPNVFGVLEDVARLGRARPTPAARV